MNSWAEMGMVEYINGVCVLDRNLHPVLLNKTRSVHEWRFSAAVGAIASFCCVWLHFPLIATLLTLAIVLSVCLFEWIPDSTWDYAILLFKSKRTASYLPSEIRFEDNEKLMSEVSVANLFVHLTKVKVSEKDPTQFRITVTYKTHRWHTWRTLSDFENAQKQLKLDFPTLPIQALNTPIAKLAGFTKDKSGTTTSTEGAVRQQAGAIVEWLHAIMDTIAICNHVDVRKLFDLPVYVHSNRYGSLYTPPHVLKSRAKTPKGLHNESAASLTPSAGLAPTASTPSKATPVEGRSGNGGGSGSMAHLSPTISSFTHGMGFLSPYMRGTPLGQDKTLSLPIGSPGASTPSSTPSHTPLSASAKASVSTRLLPKPKKMSPKKVYPIRGSNWQDVEFTDQTAEERAMYRDLRADHKFLVRGQNYMSDHKKIHAGPALCRLVIMELYEVESGVRHDHIASLGLAKERVDALNSLQEPPELFIMNFQIPGDPPVSIMSIFAAPPDLRQEHVADSREERVHKKMWRRYLDMPASNKERLKVLGLDSKPAVAVSETPETPGSHWKIPSDITWDDASAPGVYPVSDFKNTRFKLIPTVTEGNWVVRSAVPSAKPALLGQKLQQRYFRGTNYVETDVDVGSSIIASQIVGVLRGYAKHFVCDVGVVLQGECEEELPERMLACIVINKIDLDLRRSLYGPSSSDGAEGEEKLQSDLAADRAAQTAIIYGDRLDE